jgi:hypothetical protein
MLGDQSQCLTSLALATVDHLTNGGLEQIDKNRPSGSENMDVGRRVIVEVDHDPQAANAQDRGHNLLNLSAQDMAVKAGLPPRGASAPKN